MTRWRVVNADFPVALRGYDRLAVDAYVQRTSQLVAELQATRSPEAAVRRALERVGEQISGILQRAHETAEEITAQSRREAEDRLEKSRVEAARDRGRRAAAGPRPGRRHRPDLGRARADRGRRAGAGAAADRARRDRRGALPARRRDHAYDDDAALTRAPIATGEQAPLDEDLAERPREPGRRADPTSRRTTRSRCAEREPAADDLEQTVAFDPLVPGGGVDDEAAAQSAPSRPPRPRSPPPPPPPPVPADHRRSSSVIPPASQAANRRSSR